jgi:hypothetical protein
MTRKTMRNDKSPKVEQAPARMRRPAMRAPRPNSTWEPIPLHIPAPPPREVEPSSSKGDEAPRRGVVIIQYGDES